MRPELKAAFWGARRSQRSVAKQIGMSEERLSDIVCGAVDPRWSEVHRLCRALGAPAETLMRDSADDVDDGRG